jgi:hypothetical protein
MNPTALIMIALGVLLFLIGLALIVKHIKLRGIAVSLLGAALVACPFVITIYLGPNP